MTQHPEPTQHTPGEQSLPEQDGASLLGILDELHALVEHAKPVPMTASVRVNRAEMLELIEAAKNVVPVSISVAEQIVAEGNDLRDRAQAEADRLVTDAGRKADETLAAAEDESASIIERSKAQGLELIADERVVHLAEQRAREIVAEARIEAARLADNANQYCDARLAEFEEQLENLTKQAAAGREAVAKRRESVEEDLQRAHEAATEARRKTADDPALQQAEAFVHGTDQSADAHRTQSADAHAEQDDSEETSQR